MTIDEAVQIAYQQHQAGRLAEAERIYRQVLAQQPGHGGALCLLGALASQTGHWDAALDLIRRAVQINPDRAEAHYQMGIALQGMGRLDDAIAAYRLAIELKPDFAQAHNNLGIACKNLGQVDEAVASLRQATLLKPDLAETHNNLGLVLHELGRMDEAVAAYRQAIRFKPGYAAAHGAILLAMHYQPTFDPRALLIESRQWNRQHAEPLQRFIQPHSNDRNPDRRLRIGYVSPDFCEHAVSRFTLPLLAAHDHGAFEIFGYAQVPVPDGVTAKLKACCDSWRSIVGVGDEGAANMIRQDRIDILIDLAGHTSDNRLLVFAHKPAPVQATWLGYPGTTGLSAMDYRFTDANADPPGVTDEFCSERLIRLPRTNWCFEPPDDAPSVNPGAPGPAIAQQRVTFGCFNNFAKMNEPALKLWARILQAAPGSKLLLKAKVLGCASVQQRVRKVMSEAGIEPERVELLGWVPSSDHLAQYHRVDVALDTYPYNGTTTTCEAFWMGVPVVSLAGESHVSRVGASLLCNVGLPELIAQTQEQYVRIAADLANDLPRLAELRRTLRPRMQASPLMDGPRFARDVENACRQMWRDWCERT